MRATARIAVLTGALGAVLASGSCRLGDEPPEATPPATNGGSTAAAIAAPVALPADALAARAERLVGLALEEGQSHALLTELCTTAPRRLSGSPAAERAVEWGLATMRRIGLQNVRREPVVVPCWQRGAPETCQLLDPGGEVDLDILALGGSVATPAGGVTADVIMVRSFEELRSRAGEATGKIVFFNRPMPRALLNTFMAYGQAVPQRSNGATETARVGGVFALVRSMTTKIDDFPHTGAMRYDDELPRVPTAAISTEDAELLAARIEAGEPVRLHVEMSCRTLPDVESANVVGEIAGADCPDEVVVIGGHLDSWDVGQGAHDDGAGCVHALEAARLILAAGIAPRRTIRVVLFMNEENGLRGGRQYAATHAGELGRHHAAIESDTGGFEPRGFSCSAQGEAFAAIERLVDALDPYRMGSFVPGGGGADISPMASGGVPLLGMFTVSHRYFDFHHSEADRIEAVNERELALGAAALAYLASAIADTDLPPRGE